MTYATGTSVSVEKTESEIKATLRRYGATGFGSFETSGAVMIAFEMRERRIVFKLPLPQRSEKQFTHTRRGHNTIARSADAAYAAWEQGCRSKWRALLLCIKAKIESVEAGIETFEDAFLAHIQMPGGLTVGEEIREQIAHAYKTKALTPLLVGPSS